MALAPRAVVVHRRTELDELLDQHGTRGQAEFFLRSRGMSLDAVQYRHDLQADAVAAASAAIPANAARYLDRQPVIGVDPEPGRNPAVLVRHTTNQLQSLLRAVAAGSVAMEQRTMAHAKLDDGQALDTLNEVYVGHPTHQSARYRLTIGNDGVWERQSSSGLIASTGTGATGWAASISHDRGQPVDLPLSADPALAWFPDRRTPT